MMKLDFSVVFNNFAEYFLKGTINTLIIVSASMIISVLLAIPFGLMKESKFRPLRILMGAFSWITRAIPALVFLYFSYYGLIFFGINISPIVAAILGMTLSGVGYNMEFFISGLKAVNKGQYDACKSLGISYGHTIKKVVLPQALRVSVPPLFSNMNLLLKGSSLAGIVGIPELTGLSNKLISFTYRSIEILITAAVIYIVLNSVLISVEKIILKKLNFPTTSIM